jgi:hypothetical protein
MFLKKMFYASASIFLLAAAYHLGASTASAQAPNNSVVAWDGSGAYVITANGDVYKSPDALNGSSYVRVNNVFAGPPVPTTRVKPVLSWKYPRLI